MVLLLCIVYCAYLSTGNFIEAHVVEAVQSLDGARVNDDSECPDVLEIHNWIATQRKGP